MLREAEQEYKDLLKQLEEDDNVTRDRKLQEKCTHPQKCIGSEKKSLGDEGSKREPSEILPNQKQNRPESKGVLSETTWC
jgi:hypothetical protein